MKLWSKEDLLGIFLSEEILKVEDADEFWPESFPNMPLLKQFGGYEDIQEPLYIGSGEEGTVFRFKHCGKDLCLKLFKQWKYIGIIPTSEKVQMFLNPFSHESRAFARLCDVHKNGTLAVRCHGWVHLTDTQLAALKAVDKKSTDYTHWAIVKDFIPDGPHYSDISTIRSKLDIAKRALILPADVESKNYKRSFFVDLGSTITLPYPRRFWSRFEFKFFYTEGCKCLGDLDWLS